MLVFFLLSLFIFFGTVSPNANYSFPLYHVDSFANENLTEIFKKRLAEDEMRVNHLFNSISGSTVVFPVPGHYMTILNAGLSKQKIPLLIDTSSSITWWQCQCNTSCYSQFDPIYNPLEPPSTFKMIPCNQKLQCRTDYPGITCVNSGDCQYYIPYVAGASSKGEIARELVYIGDEIKTEIIFGCGHSQSGTGFCPYTTGIMGLSLGPYSLVSQLNVSIFSLCLPSIRGVNVSTLEFNVRHSPSKNSTTFFIAPPKLLHNPYGGEFHYVAIKEVLLSDTRIDVPPSYWGFDFGGQGSVIDLGVTLTYMRTDAYKSLRDNFVAQVQNHVPELSLLEVGFEDLKTCFRVEDPEAINWDDLPLPTMRINFMDNSSYDAVEAEQMLLRVSDDHIVCLAVQEATAMNITILGNTLFQRTRLTYDLSARTISFQYRSCL